MDRLGQRRSEVARAQHDSDETTACTFLQTFLREGTRKAAWTAYTCTIVGSLGKFAIQIHANEGWLQCPMSSRQDKDVASSGRTEDHILQSCMQAAMYNTRDDVQVLYVFFLLDLLSQEAFVDDNRFQAVGSHPHRPSLFAYRSGAFINYLRSSLDIRSSIDTGSRRS